MRHHVMIAALLLIRCVPAAAEDDIVKRSREQTEKKMAEQKTLIEQTMRRTKPPVDACVKMQAHELSSSSERAEVVARAVLSSCSREEDVFQQAVLHLGAQFGFPASDVLQHAHEQFYELALEVIVRDRLPSSGTRPPSR
jgi:cytochrome c556